MALCGQEKPQLFISGGLFSGTGHCHLLHPTRDGESECWQAEGVHPPQLRRVLSWGQQPEPLELSQITSILVKDKELPPTPPAAPFVHWALSQALICFTHPSCLALSMPPEPSSFPASECFCLGISFPALCQGYSLAEERLRWGGCCQPAEERGAACTAELQRGMSNSGADGDRKGKEGEIKPLLLFFFSTLARGWCPQVCSRNSRVWMKYQVSMRRRENELEQKQETHCSLALIAAACNHWRVSASFQFSGDATSLEQAQGDFTSAPLLIFTIKRY